MSAAGPSLGSMQIIMIPGLWLDAASWDAVVPALREAGHRPRALTMPGVGAPAAQSADIGIGDWVDAVVAEIDAASEPVVLVGHSGGGNVAWGAAAARPGRVARVVFVDTVPPPPGGMISEFPVVDGVVPFPGWDFFDDEDVSDLDEATRARTAPLAKSVPAKVPTDPIALSGDGRFRVPVTILIGRMDEATFREFLSQWKTAYDEFASIADAQVVTLGTGHWPQFSAPERLATLLRDAIGR